MTLPFHGLNLTSRTGLFLSILGRNTQTLNKLIMINDNKNENNNDSENTVWDQESCQDADAWPFILPHRFLTV